MADSKLSALVALLGSALASGDKFYVDDVSAGTSGSKSITVAELLEGLRPSFAALSVKDLGAKGDSTTDDTVAIQAALDIGGRIFIPPLAGGNYYKVTSPLYVTKPVDLFGAGMNSKLAVPAGTGAGVDVIKIIPAAGEQQILYRLSRFSIALAVPGEARHGVHVDLTQVVDPISLILFEMDHLYISTTGGSSLRLTNPTNTDGFWASTIRGCALHSGIFMERCGDSVTIENNILNYTKVGVELSFVPGAAQCVIENNNITSSGGAIVLHDGLQAKILRNQIEQLEAYDGTESACITLKGDTAQIYDCDIIGNNINTLGNVTRCLDVQGATDTRIENNTLTGATHVRAGAAAVRTVVATSNRFNNVAGARVPMVVTNAGAETAGPWFPVTVFSNSWAAWDAVNFPVRYSKNEAGIVTLEGMVSGGTAVAGTVMFTLPAGFWPDVTNLNFAVIANVGGAWQNGNVQINSAGQVLYYSGTNAALGVYCSFRAAP